MMLNSIRDAYFYYYEDLPEGTLQSIGMSAVYTFTYHLFTMPVAKGRVYEVNLSRPLAAAAAAALASLIHALATPIFNYIFGDTTVRFYRELIKETITLLCTHAVVNYSSVRKINLVAFQVNPYFCLDLIRAGISDVLDVIHWLDTHLVAHLFNSQALPEDRFQRIRLYLSRLGLFPQANSNSVYIAL